MDSKNTEPGDRDEIRDFPETVLFVMVVFGEKAAETVAWASLESDISSLRRNTSLLIYDNSPSSQQIPYSSYIKIHYHHDPSNPGVSKAYNFGNRLAEKEGKRWLFLLDQDTKWMPGCLLKYRDAIRQYPEGLIFAPVIRDSNGIVSPFTLHCARGIRIKSAVQGSVLLHHYQAINSGLMIDSKAFRQSGGYEDSLPLDFSDIAFLSKFQRVSPKMILVTAELHHELSGTFHEPVEKMRGRFEIYCQATRTMSRLTGRNILFWSRSLQRALHLAFRHRSISFLFIHIKIWRHRSI